MAAKYGVRADDQASADSYQLQRGEMTRVMGELVAYRNDLDLNFQPTMERGFLLAQ